MFKGRGIKRASGFLFALLMVLSLVSASGAALFPARAHAVTAPTNQTDCEALGGTWTNNDHVHNLCALPLVLSMSLEQQVQSYVYYYTLGNCLASGYLNDGNFWGLTAHQRISVADITTGQWFAGSNENGGGYLDGVSGIKTTPDGSGQAGTQIDCGQPALVKGALSLWNNWAPDEALCAFGYVRASGPTTRCTNAQGGTDEFKKGDNVESTFKAAVNARIYGGKAPSLTDSAKYLLYLKAFQQACIPNATASATPPTGSAKNDYAVRVVGGAGTAAVATTVYYTDYRNKDTSYPVYLYPDIYMSGSGDQQTCGSLVAAINGKNNKNGLDDAYVSYLKTTGETNAGTQGGKTCDNGGTVDANGNPCRATSAPTCGDAVQGIGWILCPVLTSLGNLDDGMWNFVSALLTASPVSQTQLNPDGTVSATVAYQVWGAFRSIANVVLIIIFLVMTFSQLASAGISNYGVKKLLPRLVIAAIAINISFVVVQLSVDLANIVGSSLYGLINGIATANLTVPSWQSLIGVVSGLTVASTAAAGTLLAVGPEVIFFLLLPGALTAALGFLVAIAVLILRQALIPILAVLAPLAFVAYLLPNTKSWFDKWQSMFTSMLLLFPLAALMFGGVKLAAVMINGGNSTNPQWWQTLVALIVLSVPLFMLPFLARQAGPLLGKIGGSLNGLAGKVGKPVGAWANGRRDAALTRADAIPGGRGNFGKGIRQGFIARRRRRELNSSAYKAQADTAFNSSLAANANQWAEGLQGDVAQSVMRTAGARAEEEETEAGIKSAMALITQQHLTPTELHTLAGGGDIVRGGQVAVRANEMAQRAAVRERFRTGTSGDVENLLATSGGRSEGIRQEMARGIFANGHNTKSDYLGGDFAEYVQNGAISSSADIDAAAVRRMNQGKLSPEALVGQDAGTLQRIARLMADPKSGLTAEARQELSKQAVAAQQDEILNKRISGEKAPAIDNISRL